MFQGNVESLERRSNGLSHWLTPALLLLAIVSGSGALLALFAPVERQEGAAAEQKNAAAEGEVEASVRQVFDDYKRALLTGDSVTAVRLVDKATREYYAGLRALAIDGSEEEVRGRSFIDRLLIVSMRHQVGIDAVRELELEDLIKRAVEEGWISRASIMQLEMGAVSVVGDRARGEAGTRASLNSPDAGSNPVAGLYYEFVREDGDWKFQFASLVKSLDRVISDFTAQLGTDEDALIFQLVESISGRPVLPAVWQPPGSDVDAETPSQSEPPP